MNQSHTFTVTVNTADNREQAKALLEQLINVGLADANDTVELPAV
jgi:hypothetical protein